MPHPRFQFRLRTLFVVVTIVAGACGYVGWQAKVVRERKTLADSPIVKGKGSSWKAAAPSWISSLPLWLRWQLGDVQYTFVALDDSVSDEAMHLYSTVFPEATVDRFHRFLDEKPVDPSENEPHVTELKPGQTRPPPPPLATVP